MPYGQAKEIVDSAQEFHRRASEFYRQLADKAAGARVKRLLDYLVRHEAHLERALADFKAEARSRAMEAWYQYAQEQCLMQPFDVSQYPENMTVKEVMEIGLNIDSCLVASYKGMAETATTPECREIFESLLQMEAQQKHKLARVALEIDEM
ncbi:MAG: ferritin family protein [Thermodesulfobacteriota bacterium]|nr:ferritin family protein [Thermodesulfobacteriota bacterium]